MYHSYSRIHLDISRLDLLYYLESLKSSVLDEIIIWDLKTDFWFIRNAPVLSKKKEQNCIICRYAVRVWTEIWPLHLQYSTNAPDLHPKWRLVTCFRIGLRESELVNRGYVEYSKDPKYYRETWNVYMLELFNSRSMSEKVMKSLQALHPQVLTWAIFCGAFTNN